MLDASLGYAAEGDDAIGSARVAQGASDDGYVAFPAVRIVSMNTNAYDGSGGSGFGAQYACAVGFPYSIIRNNRGKYRITVKKVRFSDRSDFC